MENLLLKGLNPKQQEAVQITEGPLMVVAGAGSGKTRVLTHRIAYLISEKGVAPYQILAVTFTNKAAEEMRTRLAQLLGSLPGKNLGSGLPLVSTFHSFGVQVLRREIQHLGYEQDFVIYDDTDQLSLLRKIMQELNFSEKDRRNPKGILSVISSAKSKLVGPDKFAAHAMSALERKAAEVYIRYEKTLETRGVLDFDDLIGKVVELWQRFPEVLEKYQDRFQYISVDEYQDTNHAQYILIKMLAQKHHNICVIGDSDQSIYSWRGANFENLLNFKQDYHEAQVVMLEQNYRSTKNILTVGNAIISKNKMREEKKLWTENEGGRPISVEAFESEQEEAQAVLQNLRYLVDEEGFSLRDCAVLYRLGAQSRALEEACLQAGVPYRLVGGVKFYARKEIKDLLAYCRLARYPQDDESFLRIVNIPARKVGATSIAHLQDFASKQGMSLRECLSRVGECEALRGPAKAALEKFAAQLDELTLVARQVPAAGVIDYINDSLGYRRFICDGTDEGETRWENIQELLGVAKKYDELEPGISLATFLEDAALFSSTDTLDRESEALTLMTLHAAKGLEYPIVFIVGMEDGILPHSRAFFDQSQLEEERRLMYVGVTRARQRLFLFRARRRLFYGGQNNPLSRFLLDLPEEVIVSEDLATEGEKAFLQSLMNFGKRD